MSSSGITGEPLPQNNDDLEVIVTNMSTDIWARLKAAPPAERALLGIAPTLAIFLLMFFLAGAFQNAPQLVFALAFLGLSVSGGLIAQFRLTRERSVLSGFAQANGYAFDEHGQVDQTYGTLFHVSDGQASDVVSGTYRGHALRLFAYTLTVQLGRSSHTYQDTVLELDLGGKLPPLLLLNKRARFGGINLEYGDQDLGLVTDLDLKNLVSLEGDFDDHFTLFSRGGQIVAREVFTPDLMQLLESSYRQFSVELAGDRAYIYAEGLLKNSADLTAMFTLAKKLVTILEPLSARFSGDNSIPATPQNGAYSIQPVTVKLNQKILWFFILLGLSPALVLVLMLVIVH